MLEDIDGSAKIIILSSDDAISSIHSKKIENMSINTAILQHEALQLNGIYSLVEFLFLGILRQRISYDENIIAEIPKLAESTGNSSSSVGVKRKRNTTANKNENCHRENDDNGKVSKTGKFAGTEKPTAVKATVAKSKTKAATTADGGGVKKNRKK